MESMQLLNRPANAREAQTKSDGETQLLPRLSMKLFFQNKAVLLCGWFQVDQDSDAK